MEERLSPALEVECVTESWGFTSLELQSKERETIGKTLALRAEKAYGKCNSILLGCH